MNGIPTDQIEKSAKKLILSSMGEDSTKQLFLHLADMERRLCERANKFLEFADGESPIEIPPEDDRVRQLQGILTAMLDSNLDELYMREWAIYHDIEPERVVGFASMDEADFTEHMEGWHAAYSDRDERFAEMDAETVARMHVQNSYGVSLDEFQDAMWIDDASILERALSGDDYDADEIVFVGLNTADTALARSMELLRDG